MSDLVGKVGVCSKGRPGLIQGRKELPWGLSWIGTCLDDGSEWASRNPVIVGNDISDWCKRGKPLSKTPVSDAAIADFDSFTRSVRARLERGKAEYGDASFGRPPSELVEELSQEAEDLAGWAFVLWSRLRGLYERVAVHGPWDLGRLGLEVQPKPKEE